MFKWKWYETKVSGPMSYSRPRCCHPKEGVRRGHSKQDIASKCWPAAYVKTYLIWAHAAPRSQNRAGGQAHTDGAGPIVGAQAASAHRHDWPLLFHIWSAYQVYSSNISRWISVGSAWCKKVKGIWYGPSKWSLHNSFSRTSCCSISMIFFFDSNSSKAFCNSCCWLQICSHATSLPVGHLSMNGILVLGC